LTLPTALATLPLRSALRTLTALRGFTLFRSGLAILAPVLRSGFSLTLPAFSSLLATAIALPGFTAAFLPAATFKCLQRYLTYVVHKAYIDLDTGFIGVGFKLHCLQLFRLNAFLVLLNDLFNTGYRKWILFVTAAIAIPHQHLENIPLLKISFPLCGFYYVGMVREHP
jgi:hypothetical protein